MKKQGWFKKNSTSVIGVIVLLVVIASIIGIMMTGNNDNQVNQQYVEEGITRDTFINAGEEGQLYISSNIQVPVTMDKTIILQLVEASLNDDKTAYEQLVSENKAFYVDSQTKIQLLSNEHNFRKVLILEGEHKDKTVFVPFQWAIK